MATYERPADRGARAARVAVARLCEEIRRARRIAGLSQVAVARAAGISRSQLGRLETGQLANPPVAAIFRVAAVIGLSVALKAYPGGDPIRDAAHARLIGRFRRRLHPSLRWRTEVPLPHAGDIRAWDGVVGGQAWEDAVEAETGIDDAQALERRLMLKRRDGGREHVILVVADTRRNHDALDASPGAFADFPMRTRQILAALAAGRHPGGSGIVLI